jgi:hypothetical protein
MMLRGGEEINGISIQGAKTAPFCLVNIKRQFDVVISQPEGRRFRERYYQILTGC